MKIFKDRVALVTGGASGIGHGMVRNFLKLGMKCVIVDFNAAYLAELREALPLKGLGAYQTAKFAVRGFKD
jgi:NAD(P)-dependent dehydrogenase (short-subunit alcohol dehydrogenase family)